MSRAACLAAAGLALSCSGAGRGPVFATSAEFPEMPRKPPSFAAETPTLSAPRPETQTDARTEAKVTDNFGVQRAEVPLDSEAARNVVGRFFIAVLMESTRELFPLFASQATVWSEGNRQPAQSVWRARFAQLDYTALSGRVVAPPQTLHTYTYASVARAARDNVTQPQARGEVVVVARPGLSWVGKTRLFGDTLAFRLRPKASQSGYEIAEIVEDFRLP